MAFMGQKGGESTDESIENPESSKPPYEGKEVADSGRSENSAIEQTMPAEEANEEALKAEVLPDMAEGTKAVTVEGGDIVVADPGKAESDTQPAPVQLSESSFEHVEKSDSLNHLQQESPEVGSFEQSESVESKSGINEEDQVQGEAVVPPESHNVVNLREAIDEQKMQEEQVVEKVSLAIAEYVLSDTQAGSGTEFVGSGSATSEEAKGAEEYAER